MQEHPGPDWLRIQMAPMVTSGFKIRLLNSCVMHIKLYDVI